MKKDKNRDVEQTRNHPKPLKNQACQIIVSLVYKSHSLFYFEVYASINETVHYTKGTKTITTQPPEQADGHAQQSQQTSNVHFHGPAPVYVVQAEKNGLAVAGFVLSLCALVLSWTILVGGICWILAVVFSAVGLHAANTKGKPHRGLAIAGLVISIAPLVIIIALIATAATFWG